GLPVTHGTSCFKQKLLSLRAEEVIRNDSRQRWLSAQCQLSYGGVRNCTDRATAADGSLRCNHLDSLTRPYSNDSVVYSPYRSFLVLCLRTRGSTLSASSTAKRGAWARIASAM